MIFKAVAEVESAGAGFLSDGRVKILFEGHKFYKYTKGAYAQSNPTICYPKWTKAFYAKGPNAYVRGAGELARLDEAIALGAPFRFDLLSKFITIRSTMKPQKKDEPAHCLASPEAILSFAYSSRASFSVRW